MIKTTLERFRQQLLLEQSRLEKELTRVGAWHEESAQSDAMGELSDYDNHPADVATETYEREKSYALEENIDDLLRRVASALERVEAGTYGTCVICGGKIRPERLEAIPYADLCLECQATIETQ